MKTKLQLLLCFIFAINLATAQEFFGGEIRVRQLATYSVSATVNLFVDIHEEMDSIYLCWGNGACDSIPMIYSESYPNSSMKFMQFESLYTYGGQDTYTLTVQGCCWSDRVVNIAESATEDFYLSTDFFLSVNDPLFGENMMPSFSRGFALRDFTSPILTYESNFSDPEGDEVQFEICAIDYVSTYYQPTEVFMSPANQIFFDTLDGSFLWAAPQQLGKYVAAVCVSEYRNGILISEQTRNIVLDVDPFVSNQEIEQDREIEIFPNPANSFLRIKMAEDSSYKGVLIFDSLGKKVKEDKAVQELDVSNLSNGIYILQLRFGDQFYNKKIIINH